MDVCEGGEGCGVCEGVRVERYVCVCVWVCGLAKIVEPF